MEDTYPIGDLCAAFDVSRAGFYSWRQRETERTGSCAADLGVEIDTLFARSRRTHGSPRLHRALCPGRARLRAGTGWPGSCGVAGSSAECGAAAARAPRTAIIWSPSRRIGLGQREAPVARPNEVWAADITYVPTDEGWLYLAGLCSTWAAAASWVGRWVKVWRQACR